ncbi:MAG: DUF3786 domain-containing protein [Deltaproteobacteria bacterium]|nr:DUF3786 domain-containing protein [Deltaproteobacteria bacterium]
MTEMNASQDELFRWADQIPPAAWTDLHNRSPQQATEAVGAAWDGESFKVPLLGIEYSVNPGKQQIQTADKSKPRVDYQTGIVLLTTLSMSKGVPPSGRMTVPQELAGGRMFFTGAHAVPNKQLAKYVEKNPDKLLDRALGIGGEMIEGADIAFRVPGLPYVPLYVLYWRGDQESPSRAVIGIDDRALFHLDLAGVFGLTNILVFRFCRGA